MEKEIHFYYNIDDIPIDAGYYLDWKETLEALENNAHYKLRGTERVFSGSVLMNCGIAHTLYGDFASELMIFDKI